MKIYKETLEQKAILIIEQKDVENWNELLKNIRGYVFEYIFSIPTLTLTQMQQIMFRSANIYECGDLYEQWGTSLFH